MDVDILQYLVRFFADVVLGCRLKAVGRLQVCWAVVGWVRWACGLGQQVLQPGMGVPVLPWARGLRL